MRARLVSLVVASSCLLLFAARLGAQTGASGIMKDSKITVDGRIDDAKAGWKGRGLWANYGMYTPWHEEGGKGSTSKAVHFQLRPDPLAK